MSAKEPSPPHTGHLGQPSPPSSPRHCLIPHAPPLPVFPGGRRQEEGSSPNRVCMFSELLLTMVCILSELLLLITVPKKKLVFDFLLELYDNSVYRKWFFLFDNVL